ncbi:hypothetical protein AB1L42_17920 [Thalassoglobus sp. JC818]|uniref:hypothetical protein n=1 Tax=Thalassoglobus sp. JC818 TaxID=3232136 RepID=UPI003457CBB7
MSATREKQWTIGVVHLIVCLVGGAFVAVGIFIAPFIRENAIATQLRNKQIWHEQYWGPQDGFGLPVHGILFKLKDFAPIQHVAVYNRVSTDVLELLSGCRKLNRLSLCEMAVGVEETEKLVLVDAVVIMFYKCTFDESFDGFVEESNFDYIWFVECSPDFLPRKLEFGTIIQEGVATNGEKMLFWKRSDAVSKVRSAERTE